MTNKLPIYRSPDGREWIIDEGHPDTDTDMAVCRVLERGTLQHTAVWTRKELTRTDDTHPRRTSHD